MKLNSLKYDLLIRSNDKRKATLSYYRMLISQYPNTLILLTSYRFSYFTEIQIFCLIFAYISIFHPIPTLASEEILSFFIKIIVNLSVKLYRSNKVRIILKSCICKELNNLI
jgi:hypothetical protein